MIDPTTRTPSPPGEILLEAYENLSEIMWEGADGNLVKPIPITKYAALAEVHYPDPKDFTTIYIPEKHRQWVKFKNLCKIQGDYQLVPNHGGLSEIGAVIGFGKTLEEAVEEVKKHAEGLEGFGLKVQIDALDEAGEYVKNGESIGIKF